MMGEIPEHIWEAARSLRGAVLWESNSSVEHIARALLAAEQRGKEEAAKIAEGIAKEVGAQALNPMENQLGKAIASCAAAIRGS